MPRKKKSPFETVGFISSSAEFSKQLRDLGHKAVKTGQIIGVTGALVSWSYTAKSDDPPLTAMLAPDPVQIPDQRGALLAINLIKDIFKVNIDTSELESEAKRVADKIQNTIEDIRQQIKRQYAQQSKPPPGMYL